MNKQELQEMLDELNMPLLDAVKTIHPIFLNLCSKDELLDFIGKIPTYYFGFVYELSEEAQLKLLHSRKIPGIIQYIQNPTKAALFEAVKITPSNLRWVKNPSDELQEYAINIQSCAIGDIENPSENAQLLAISKNKNAIGWIKNPTKIALKKHMELYGKVQNKTE